MAIRLSSLRADTKRENDGDWVSIPDWPEVELKVRSINYGPFVNARSIALAKLARRYGRDPIPADVGYREDAKLYHEHLLIDWRGFDEPYERDLALETLMDPGFRQLHDHIRYAAARVGETEAQFVEDAAKNSLPSSAGGSRKAA